MTFALYFVPDAFSLQGKIMGRQSAGASFLRAIADARLPHLFAFSRDEALARRLANELSALGASRTGVGFIAEGDPTGLSRAGLLFKADPGIGFEAWRRQALGDARAWSVCGITHTISSHAAMSAIADLVTAPVYSWDALIVTSQAALAAVRTVVEAQVQHLHDRLGATRFTLPQMPVIPLGIHTSDFEPNKDTRNKARQALGLEPDEVAFLFAGRLIIHGKAHPLPMYVALEQAAQGRRIALIQAGVAPNSHMARIFAEEPKKLCPSVRIINVEGRNFDMYRNAWAAADVFTSLSDNIQETQGLTPIEAMAAGLPCVVTDWDGYKDSIRDGVDGFRVPTLMLSAGMGGGLADRHDIGVDNFDYYSGLTSQLIAADVSATATAYRRLIDDPDLRRRMGEAGRVRAREVFDWAVIFKRYQDLWAELANMRRSASQTNLPVARRRAPNRADPFAMFAGHATGAITAHTRFQPTLGASAQLAKAYQTLPSISFAQVVLPPADLLDALFYAWPTNAWPTFEEIMRGLPHHSSHALAPALVWLAKMGLLTFREGGISAAGRDSIKASPGSDDTLPKEGS